MFFELIGQFETDGNLVVTDPCYDLKTWCNYNLKVKSGLYDVYIVYGKLKRPIFSWDKREGNYRNAQLIIIHNDYKGKFNFKKVAKARIGVDSGQAGFFNVSNYKKDFNDDFPLDNYRYHFFKETIGSKLMEIETYEESINSKNDLFVRMNEHFKDEEKTINWFNTEIINSKSHIENYSNILKTKDYPSYLKLKYTKDFYEIICDLTSGEFSSGTLNKYGAVSSSGEGDGSYSLLVSKNKHKEVVSALIEFISLNNIAD